MSCHPLCGKFERKVFIFLNRNRTDANVLRDELFKGYAGTGAIRSCRYSPNAIECPECQIGVIELYLIENQDVIKRGILSAVCEKHGAGILEYVNWFSDDGECSQIECMNYGDRHETDETYNGNEDYKDILMDGYYMDSLEGMIEWLKKRP